MGKHSEIYPDKLVMWHTELYNAMSDDGCFLCLTDKEVYLLLQATRQMEWSSRWRVADGDSLPDIKALASTLEEKLMTCDSLQYREDPTDSCVLQYSLDGGTTWQDAFDFSTCIKTQVKPIVDAEGQRILDELMDKWDGTANSISANLVYDGGADDTHRDVALCNALELWVDAMCDAEIARRGISEQYWEEMPDIFLGLSVALLGVPIPGFRFLAMASALVSVFIEIAAPIWDLAVLAALEDEDARELVACTMYKHLSGATPTASKFATALDTPLYSPVSYAALIGNAIKPMLGELEVFVTFLQVWADVYPFAKGGFLTSCNCPDLGWTVQFLLSAGEPPNVNFITESPFKIHTYNNPQDRYENTDTVAEDTSSAFISFEFDIAGTTTLLWMSVNIDMDSDGPNTWASGQEFMAYDDVAAEVLNFTDPGYHQNNTPATATWEGVPVSNVQKVHLRQRIYEPDNGRNTWLHTYMVLIHGQGTIPPEWAAYEV